MQFLGGVISAWPHISGGLNDMLSICGIWNYYNSKWIKKILFMNPIINKVELLNLVSIQGDLNLAYKGVQVTCI